MKNSNLIENEIHNRCSMVFDTQLMNEAKTQVHHNCTTLYDHIMRVAYFAVESCNKYENEGIHLDRQLVVTAAVCHDLGIVGRKRKFKSDPEAWFRHARLSVDETKSVIPDVDEKTLRAIRKHMWPITFVPPTTLEEWVLIKADKRAWAYEFLNRNKLRKLKLNFQS